MNRRAFTLVELLVYLGIAGVVMLGTTTFLVRMLGFRLTAAAQTAVQENARVVVDRMTVDIRNSYLVNVVDSMVEISSHPAADPSTIVVTVYALQAGRIVTGTGTDSTTAAAAAQPLTDANVTVSSWNVAAASSALQVQLTVAAGGRTTSLASTIAVRQTSVPAL